MIVDGACVADVWSVSGARVVSGIFLRWHASPVIWNAPSLSKHSTFGDPINVGVLHCTWHLSDDKSPCILNLLFLVSYTYSYYV